MLILANAYVAVFGLLLAGRLADAARLVHRTLSATRIAAYQELLHTAVLVFGAEVAISQGPDNRPDWLWTLALDRLDRGYAAGAVLIAIEAVERGTVRQPRGSSAPGYCTGW